MPLFPAPLTDGTPLSEFGACGPGENADAAFAAAFASPPSRLLLPPHEMVITTALAPPAGFCAVGNKYRTVIRPSSAVAAALTLQANNEWRGFTIDGQDTSAKKGLVIGTGTDDEIAVRDFIVKTFAGSGAVGVEVGGAVQPILDNGFISGCQRGCVFPAGGGVPTATQMRGMKFHSSVEEGLYMATALVAHLDGCRFENNGKAGMEVASGGNVWGVVLTNPWLEGNCTASGSYQLLGEDAGIDVLGGYFSDDTIKAIHLLGASRFRIKNVQCKNDTAWILVAGTSNGFIEEWPANLDYDDVVSITSSGRVNNGPEADWLSWTPNLTCSGSMTIGTTTISRAKYRVVGQICHMELAFSGTLGGTAAAAVYASLPSGIGAANNSTVFLQTAAVNGDGNATPAVALATNAAGGQLGFYSNSIAANWALGASFQAYLCTSFEVG